MDMAYNVVRGEVPSRLPMPWSPRPRRLRTSGCSFSKAWAESTPYSQLCWSPDRFNSCVCLYIYIFIYLFVRTEISAPRRPPELIDGSNDAELSQWVQTLFRFRRFRQGHELRAENHDRPGKIEENLASRDLCFHSRARETSTKGLKRHTVGKLVESAFGWSQVPCMAGTWLWRIEGLKWHFSPSRH